MSTQVGVEGVVPDFTIGDRLRKARTYAGLTVAELAQRAGISEKTINNYEGERVSPRRPSLIAWALATGVSLEWLESGTGSTKPPTPPSGQPVPKVDEAGLDALRAAKRSRRGRTAEYLPAA